jgi:hypothetical protein
MLLVRVVVAAAAACACFPPCLATLQTSLSAAGSFPPSPNGAFDSQDLGVPNVEAEVQIKSHGHGSAFQSLDELLHWIAATPIQKVPRAQDMHCPREITQSAPNHTPCEV